MKVATSVEKIRKYTSIRTGETKLGQVLASCESNIFSLEELDRFLSLTNAPFVIVGIAEDVGVRANYGQTGADKAYDSFLSYFVNLQQNQFLMGENVLLLGEIYVEDIQVKSIGEIDVYKLREYCAEVDDRVYPVIRSIVNSGKIPIVIGGGHNNSYGILKGSSLALKMPIDVLNIDPHADCRAEEGRHSGNGFSYALSEGYIHHYGVWGLHENYNNQMVVDRLSQHAKLFYHTFDSMIGGHALTLHDFLSNFSESIALEIDLDAIKNMPTSARTPVGFTEEEVLECIQTIGRNKRIQYYHFAEGSPSDIDSYKVGKFLSYAVSSILKMS